MYEHPFSDRGERLRTLDRGYTLTQEAITEPARSTRMTTITSDSEFVITASSESSGTSQQIEVAQSPTVTLSGENTRLLHS